MKKPGKKYSACKPEAEQKMRLYQKDFVFGWVKYSTHQHINRLLRQPHQNVNKCPLSKNFTSTDKR